MEDFSLYARKMYHDFNVTVNRNNFERAIGVTKQDAEELIVAREGAIIIFDPVTYEEKYDVDLALPKSTTREPLEIISLCVSDDSSYIALFIGKQLIKDEELIMKLIILKKSNRGRYEHFKEIDMEKQGMSNVCKRLYFDQ